MGTKYKSGSPTFRSISDNAEALKNDPRYRYSEGYFGPIHKGSKNSHDLKFDDPIKESKTFYDKLSYGGIEREIGPNHWLTKMKDGTYVDYRVLTSSQNSPAVLINVKMSADSGGIKYHKVHFSKETGGE